MGEKGNFSDVAVAGAVGGASSSLIERVTTSATETVTGVGQDFLDTVKDKSIGAVADNTVTAAREKMQRKPADPAAQAGLPAGTDRPAAGAGGPGTAADDEAN